MGEACGVKPQLAARKFCAKHAGTKQAARKVKTKAKAKTKGKAKSNDCAWIFQDPSPRLGQQCDKKAAGKLPYCTRHLRTKQVKYELAKAAKDAEIGRWDACYWKLICNRAQRQYLEPAGACDKFTVPGTNYCVKHLYLRQAWDETIKDIPARCEHIIRSKKGHRVCQKLVEPGYKKCQTHSRRRGRPTMAQQAKRDEALRSATNR
uniref:Uncharacterized protein n=1 Tax=Pithovirus LCPAC103 TaxID=2506588 RepID=A0A481Z3G3_9VIRU|nr:MAG: hypothetical protein LCPAC103_01140 [Pithovirus LCPAC103]